MNRTQELVEQTHNLTKLGYSISDIFGFFKMARSLHKIHENQCNGYSGYRSVMKENRDLKKERQIVAIIGQIPNLTIQSDPRGCPLHFKDIDSSKGKFDFYIWG
jgi:hypothetical protein